MNIIIKIFLYLNNHYNYSGEEDALRQQRNTELLIQCSSLPISIQTLEPVYENAHEIPDKSTVLMTQSPAYETVPVRLTLSTSPN